MGAVGPVPGPALPEPPGAVTPPVTPRRVRGRNRNEIADWLEEVNPQETADLEDLDLLVDFSNTPTAKTKSGRVTRPPAKYSDDHENMRAREIKDLEKVRRLSIGRTNPDKLARKAATRFETNAELLAARRELAEAEAELRREEAERVRLQAEAEAEATRELTREEEAELLSRSSTLVQRTPPSQIGVNFRKSTLTARTPVPSTDGKPAQLTRTETVDLSFTGARYKSTPEPIAGPSGVSRSGRSVKSNVLPQSIISTKKGSIKTSKSKGLASTQGDREAIEDRTSNPFSTSSRIGSSPASSAPPKGLDELDSD